MGNIIVLIIFVLFAGFVAWRMLKKKKVNSGSNSGIGQSPPSFMRGLSFGYVALSYSLEKNIKFFDLLKDYNFNMFRILLYGAWDDFNWKPWAGGWNSYMGDMDTNNLNHIRNFITEANNRGLWVILSLFQANAGGGTENITSRDKGELATYIARIVEATKDKGVIYETVNEIDDKGFQEWVLGKLNEHGVKYTCSYLHDIGATYKNTHTTDKEFTASKGNIQSNDVGGYDTKLNAEDYKNIARGAKEQEGHFEYLAYWGIEEGSGENREPDKLKANWGELMEFNKGL